MSYQAILNSVGNTLTLNNTSTPSSIVVNSVNVQAGTLSVGLGASLGGIPRFPGDSSLTLSNQATIVVQGSINASVLTNTSTGYIENAGVLTAGVVDNSGVIAGVLTAGVVDNSGVIKGDIESGDIFNRAGATITGGLSGGPGSVQNAGTLNISASLFSGFSNTGTVNLTGIITAGARGFSNYGVINVSPIGGIDIYGRAGIASAGNDGRINLAGSLNFDGCSTPAPDNSCFGLLSGLGTINLEGGSINNIGTYDFEVDNGITGHGLIGGEVRTGLIVPVGTITVTGSVASCGVATLGAGDRLDIGGYMQGGSLCYYGQTNPITTVERGGVISATGYTQNAGSTVVHAGGLITGGSFDIGGGNVQLDGTVGPNGVTVGPGGSLTGTGTVLGDLVMAGLYSSENMTVFGDATLEPGSVFDESIFGLDDFSQFLVSGSASLDGTLSIDLSKGYIPTIGSKFFIIDSSSVSGVFANVTGEAIDGREKFEVLYNSNNVELCVVSTSNPVCGATPPSVPEPRGIFLLGTVAAGVLWRVKRRPAESR
jgi:hypothetical protein